MLDAPTLPASPRQDSGMSLVEVLVAVAIMALVALAILPLFTRAVRQNREGGNFTEVTNVARSALEEYLQLDFNAPRLTVADGQTILRRQDYWDPVNRRWEPYDPAAPPFPIESPPVGVLWHRAIDVQQFTSGDLLEDGALDDPLDGSVSDERVQLKLIRVTVQPLWNSFASGRPSPIALEGLKAV
jgi:prepilin-type N-terminal cleavage/methylation domain-containing protein